MVKQPRQQRAVSGSAMPSTLAGRKWRWKAFTISRGGTATGGGVAVALQRGVEFAEQRPPAGLGPQADAGGGERLPRKAPAGIDLALRGDVGMADHVARLDRRMAREDAAAELDQRGDLRGG